MFQNAFAKLSSHISTGYNNLKDKISFGKIQDDTVSAVNSIFDATKNAANDSQYKDTINDIVEKKSQNTQNIIQPTEAQNIQVLGNFSGKKILTLKNQKYKLIFQEGVIIKALKEVNDNYIHVNAKTIRKLSTLLTKSSHEVEQVSYSTKRNTQNSFNTRLDGQFTYTNDAQTQFTIIANKGEIKRTYYKNTTIIPSQEEINIIQSSINTGIKGLSGYKTMRAVKKELQKEKNSREKIQEVSHKYVKENVDLPDLNGNKKHDDYQKLKYKNKLREEKRQQEEKNKIIRGSFIKQDLQLLSKHQFMLSKTDKIGNIEYIRQRKDKDGNITNTFDFNQQQAALLEVFTILGARKGIYNLGDIKKFINTPSKLHVFKGQILSYLEGNIPEEMEDNRNALLNIFNNALEVNLQHIPKEKVYGTLIDGTTGKKSKYSK